ncbi:MAG: hypothetical protein U0S12_00725 [Fimbriimonadales bacterium]
MDPENAGSRRLIPPLPPSAVGASDEFGSSKPLAIVIVSDEADELNLAIELGGEFELVSAPSAGQAFSAVRDRIGDRANRLPRCFFVFTDDLPTIGHFRRLVGFSPILIFVTQDEGVARLAQDAGANEILLNNRWL